MNKNYSSEIKETIERLTGLDSAESLFHQNRDGDPFPSRSILKEVVSITRSVLFPGFFGNDTINTVTLPYHVGVNTERIFSLLWEQIFAGLCFDCSSEKRNLTERKTIAMDTTVAFIKKLPQIRAQLATDVEATFRIDPAAKSYGEVILSYPGLMAISNYRIAHELLLLKTPIIPRIITEMTHSETGIDIHPGATIGDSFAIDHGTGVVIGETTIIGKNATIYQGVTLGAKSFPVDENNVPIKGIPRHPILKDNVVVYAGATILGRITIGENAVIGGNTWITEDVEDNGKVFIK